MRGQLQAAADINPVKLPPVPLNGQVVEFKTYLDNLGKRKFLPEIQLFFLTYQPSHYTNYSIRTDNIST
jgi:hypothetical protein